MNIRLIALAGLTACFLFGVLRGKAADPMEELIATLAGIDALQGRFEQRQYDDTGKLVTTSSGRFRLLRPGYFAWEIESPDSQLVIADPHYIWHYDRDLETVTRRPVGGSADTSPLQILGGDESVLRDQFEVVQPAPDRFQLTATAGDADFRALTLRMAGGDIVGMDVVNRLNQRIEIDFLAVDRDAGLTPADFAFEPPAAADLFYHEQ